MVTSVTLRWLLNVGAAAVFALSIGAPSTSWAKQVKNQGPPGPQGPAGPAGPTGATGPTGPAGAGADPILILKGASHNAHAAIAHDTRWCGIADCDKNINSAFELGAPVGPGTVSKLRVSLGEEPPPTWEEDEDYFENDKVVFNGQIWQALDFNEDCMPNQTGGGCGGEVRWVLYTGAGSTISGKCTPGTPNSGNAYVFYVCVGHADGTVTCPDTRVTCTVDDGETSCSDLVDAYATVEGDVVFIQASPQSDPHWCAFNATVDYTATP